MKSNAHEQSKASEPRHCTQYTLFRRHLVKALGPFSQEEEKTPRDPSVSTYLSMATAERLPEGWLKGVHPKSHIPFYYNVHSKASSWAKPTGTAIANGAGGQDTGHPFIVKKAAADGWEEAYDTTNRRSYWYNRKTRQRTWTSPGTTHLASANDAIQQAWAGAARRRATRDGLRAELDLLRELRDALCKQQEEYRRRIAEEYEAFAARLARLERMRARFESVTPLPAAAAKRGRASSAAHDIWGGAGVPTLSSVDSVSALPSFGSISGRSMGTRPGTRKVRRQSTLHRICKTTGSRINMHAEAQQLKAKLREKRRESIMAIQRKSKAGMGGAGPLSRMMSRKGGSGMGAARPLKVLAEAKSASFDDHGPEHDDPSLSPDTRAERKKDASLHSEHEKLKRLEDHLKAVNDEIDGHEEVRKEVEKLKEHDNFYGVLGLKPDCSSAKLKLAHRKMMIKWHPDKNPGKVKEAAEASALVQEAFEVLKNKWERMMYDWFDHAEYLQHRKVISCFKNYMWTGFSCKHFTGGGGMFSSSTTMKRMWMAPDGASINLGKKQIMLDEISMKEFRQKGQKIPFDVVPFEHIARRLPQRTFVG